MIILKLMIWLLSVIAWAALAGADSALVCDAGSTGTRIYAFSSTKDDTVEMTLIGKLTPGLSSFALAQNISGAVEQLVPIIREGFSVLGSVAPVHILGTGGVRSLSEDAQKKLWAELAELLEMNLGKVEIKMHAIHGKDEAFFGLVSANFLFPGGVGILDLGGSSVEIAHAGDDEVLGSDDDVLVTHANLGTEKVRRLVDTACEPGDEKSGFACREKIKQLLSQSEIEKLLHGGSQKFLGISAFVYSLDFASWLLEMRNENLEFTKQYPQPSVSAIRGACNLICSLPVDTELFTRHKMTNEVEAQGRCFDICYVAELLESFGFSDDDRRVSFVLEIQGKEIEWTLGYYLTHVQRKSEIPTRLYQEEL